MSKTVLTNIQSFTFCLTAFECLYSTGIYDAALKMLSKEKYKMEFGKKRCERNCWTVVKSFLFCSFSAMKNWLLLFLKDIYIVTNHRRHTFLNFWRKLDSRFSVRKCAWVSRIMKYSYFIKLTIFQKIIIIAPHAQERLCLDKKHIWLRAILVKICS